MLMSQRWDFLSDGKTSRFGDKAIISIRFPVSAILSKGNCRIEIKALPLQQQIPPASRKISVPSGTFLFYGSKIHTSSHNNRGTNKRSKTDAYYFDKQLRALLRKWTIITSYQLKTSYRRLAATTCIKMLVQLLTVPNAMRINRLMRLLSNATGFSGFVFNTKSWKTNGQNMGNR